jgi:hypothetical protein
MKAQTISLILGKKAWKNGSGTPHLEIVKPTLLTTVITSAT